MEFLLSQLSICLSNGLQDQDKSPQPSTLQAHPSYPFYILPTLQQASSDLTWRGCLTATGFSLHLFLNLPFHILFGSSIYELSQKPHGSSLHGEGLMCQTCSKKQCKWWGAII